MFCNKITIPEFTKEQIAECQKCKHASAKKAWCCHFGVWIRKGGRIITQDKRIRVPRQRLPYLKTGHAGFATQEDRFRHHYKIALDGARRCGKPTVNETTFVKRRQACTTCPPEYKSGCPCVGCKWWQKLVFVSEDEKNQRVECLKGRWPS